MDEQISGENSRHTGREERSVIGASSDGRVTLVAPTATRLEVARAYAISKLAWIRNQQEELRGQARETPRAFVERKRIIFGAGAIC